MQLGDRAVGISFVLKGDETAPLGAAVRLLHHVGVQHRPDRLEVVLQVLPAHCPCQVAHVDVLAAALATAAESATPTSTAAAALAVRARTSVSRAASPHGPTISPNGLVQGNIHRRGVGATRSAPNSVGGGRNSSGRRASGIAGRGVERDALWATRAASFPSIDRGRRVGTKFRTRAWGVRDDRRQDVRDVGSPAKCARRHGRLSQRRSTARRLR